MDQAADLVSADFGLELAIARSDPSDLLAVSVLDWSRRDPRALELLARLAVEAVGTEARDLPLQPQLAGQGRVAEEHVDLRDTRLEYLVKLVNRHGWEHPLSLDICQEFSSLLADGLTLECDAIESCL